MRLNPGPDALGQSDPVGGRQPGRSRVVTAWGEQAPIWTAALQPLPAHEPGDLLDLGSGDRLVVAVPHPDDETLGVGGILQRLHGSGVHLVLVLASAGRAAYGDTGRATSALGRTRIREFHDAIAVLGLDGAQVHELDLPDGELDLHEASLIQALDDLLHTEPLRAGSRTAVLGPWPLDPHPDHQAVGRASGIAARRAGALRWSYPIWMRHAMAPDTPAVPWPDIRRVPLSPEESKVKRAAIEIYKSQLDGPSPEVEPVLPTHVIEHFTDGQELLIAPSPSETDAALHFEALYEGNDDPWEVATSWYELRKRAVLLASLPRPRFECVWEPGCSLGHLSAELALRCDRLVSTDVSPLAIERARAAVFAEHVSFAVQQTPIRHPDLAPGSCDLVVLSEFLYYLPDSARAGTIKLAGELLRPDGHLVVVHWRGQPADAHCPGEQANSEAAASLGHILVHHVDESFVLDITQKTGEPE